MYDECAYAKRLQQSMGPYHYSMFPGKYATSSQCRIELGIVGGNNVSLSNMNLVDLESDLRGQTRVASQCPDHHYVPSQNSEQLNHLPNCQMMSFPSLEKPSPNTLSPFLLK